MAIGSSIEWTEATWNPVVGCTPVSAGCRNCYAARLALRLASMGKTVGAKYGGIAKRSKNGIPVFTGRLKCNYESLGQPLRWRKPRLIFVNSMSDLFHEEVPLSFIQKVFAAMQESNWHTFQILTKRPERAEELASKLHWSPNVWMGTSVEDGRVCERISFLRKIPAAVRFLSCEPLLGPLENLNLSGIHWVIAGGESGPLARPIRKEWVNEIKEQCVKNNVAFFFKQWGGTNKKATGRRLDGRIWSQMPSVGTHSTFPRTSHDDQEESRPLHGF